MIFELAQDFHDAVMAMPHEHPKYRILELLEEAIRRHIHFIDDHPIALFQCMWNTCWWYDCPEVAKHYEEPEGGWKQPPTGERPSFAVHDFLEVWRCTKDASFPGFRWVRSLRPPVTHVGGAQRAVLPAFSGNLYAGTVYQITYSESEGLLLAVTSEGTIITWDPLTGEEINRQRLELDDALGDILGMNLDTEHLVGYQTEDGHLRVWHARTGKLLQCIFVGGEHGWMYGGSCSADGTHIAVLHKDRRVQIWNAQEGHRVNCIDCSADTILLSASGNELFCFSTGGTLDIWDTATGRLLSRLTDTERFEKSVLALNQEAGLVAVFREEGTASIWNIRTGKLLHHIHQHFGADAVTFTNDGSRLVTGSSDGGVRVWNVASGALLACYRGHERGITAIAVDASGRWIFTGSLDGSVRMWDSTTPHEYWKLRGHESRIEKLAFRPDARRIATKAWDAIWLWDLQYGTAIRQLDVKSNSTAAPAFSFDCRALVGSADFAVLVWDADTGEEVCCIDQNHEPVDLLAVSRCGRRIAVASHKGSYGYLKHTVKVWDVGIGKLLFERRLSIGPANVSFSPDDSFICVEDVERHTYALDAISGQDCHYVAGHELSVNCAVFSPGADYLITGGSDGTIRVWNIATSREEVCLGDRRSCISALAAGQDGKRVFCGQESGLLQAWDLTTSSQTCSMEGHRGRVNAIAVSPDGLRLFSGGADGTIRIWELKTGRELTSLTQHDKAVTALDLSPDGSRLLTGDAGGTIIEWDLPTGRAQKYHITSDPVIALCARCAAFALRGIFHMVVGDLKRQRLKHCYSHESIRSAAFRPDGKRIAAGLDSGSVRVWDTRTGAVVSCYQGHSGDVPAVGFSPDGHSIFSGGYDRSVRLWDSRTGAELSCLRGRWERTPSAILPQLQQPAILPKLDTDPDKAVFTLRKCNSSGMIEIITGEQVVGWIEWHMDMFSESPEYAKWAGTRGPYFFIFALEGRQNKLHRLTLLSKTA